MNTRAITDDELKSIFDNRHNELLSAYLIVNYIEQLYLEKGFTKTILLKEWDQFCDSLPPSPISFGNQKQRTGALTYYSIKPNSDIVTYRLQAILPKDYHLENEIKYVYKLLFKILRSQTKILSNQTTINYLDTQKVIKEIDELFIKFFKLPVNKKFRELISIETNFKSENESIKDTSSEGDNELTSFIEPFKDDETYNKFLAFSKVEKENVFKEYGCVYHMLTASNKIEHTTQPQFILWLYENNFINKEDYEKLDKDNELGSIKNNRSNARLLKIEKYFPTFSEVLQDFGKKR